MRGVNKVILVGTLGRDPEVRYLPSGNAVCNLSLATSEVWKDKQTGEAKEQTEWHRVVFMGKLAEVAGEYLKKGSKVYVEGSIHTRKYQDKQTGQDRYSTEIKGATMQMLDSRPQGGGSQGGGQDHTSGGSFPSYEDFDQSASQAPARGAQQRPAPAPLPDDFNDDIPF